ncbi:hypothetical protein GJAV_G00170930 [Gymnothorax javanicus]|nr:hypothetical protein GJAV_G00170930 [Gymnothorax javanicus]
MQSDSSPHTGSDPQTHRGAAELLSSPCPRHRSSLLQLPPPPVPLRLAGVDAAQLQTRPALRAAHPVRSRTAPALLNRRTYIRRASEKEVAYNRRDSLDMDESSRGLN